MVGDLFCSNANTEDREQRRRTTTTKTIRYNCTEKLNFSIKAFNWFKIFIILFSHKKEHFTHTNWPDIGQLYHDSRKTKNSTVFSWSFEVKHQIILEIFRTSAEKKTRMRKNTSDHQQRIWALRSMATFIFTIHRVRLDFSNCMLAGQ